MYGYVNNDVAGTPCFVQRVYVSTKNDQHVHVAVRASVSSGMRTKDDQSLEPLAVRLSERLMNVLEGGMDRGVHVRYIQGVRYIACCYEAQTLVILLPYRNREPVQFAVTV